MIRSKILDVKYGQTPVKNTMIQIDIQEKYPPKIQTLHHFYLKKFKNSKHNQQSIYLSKGNILPTRQHPTRAKKNSTETAQLFSDSSCAISYLCYYLSFFGIH